MWCAHQKFLFWRNTQPVSELPDSFEQVNTGRGILQNAECRTQNAERRMMVSGIECETCAFWREGGSDELLFTRLLHHG